MPEKSRIGPINIFVAYVSEDEDYFRQIEKVLKVLKLQQFKISWEESRVTAGMEWEKENRNRLNNADLILLLVSFDFLASEHSQGKPVQQAIKRHNEGQAWVIPIIVRPCIWNKAKFAKLTPLPKDGKPMVDWPTIDHALVNIGDGIKEAIEKLLQPSQKTGNITPFPKTSKLI